MNLALEFMGAAAQVKDLDTARELLDHANAPNTGIALDSYHFFAGGSSFRALEEFPISQILLVHLADGPADLSDPSLELDRQMPGYGELRLREFVQMVHAKGFRGYWHVECIQGRDYATDLKAVAQRALTSMRGVVEDAIHQHR